MIEAWMIGALIRAEEDRRRKAEALEARSLEMRPENGPIEGEDGCSENRELFV